MSAFSSKAARSFFLLPSTFDILRYRRCPHFSASAVQTESATRRGAMIRTFPTSKRSCINSEMAVKVMTVFPRPISRKRPAAGLSRICWMARRWYGYGLNFIYPPPHKLIHPFRGVNHLDMETQLPEFLMPFQLKRPGLLPRRFEFDEDNFSARQEDRKSTRLNSSHVKI